MPGAKDDMDGFSDRFKTILELVVNAIGDAGEVLVIDDQNSVRMSLIMLLQPYYEVYTAGNAVQALEILRTRNIDLVTLDLQLPESRGEELLPVIRAIRPGAEIILLTSSLSLKSAISGIHHGVQDYLAKPFDTIDFLYATQSAVKKKKALDSYTALLKEIGRDLESEAYRTVESLVGFMEGRKWIRGESANLA